MRAPLARLFVHPAARLTQAGGGCHAAESDFALTGHGPFANGAPSLYMSAEDLCRGEA